MSKALAILGGYLAAVAVSPLLFLAAAFVARPPTPRFIWAGGPFDNYLTIGVIALITALPGFVLGRTFLYFTGAESAVSFMLFGLLTGILAIMIFSPSYLYWVFVSENVVLVAAVVGMGASLVYWLVERWILRSYHGSNTSVLSRRVEKESRV